MGRGKLIWWEGGEGGGKSTHSLLTEKYLTKKGIKFEIAREPGGTPLAEKIRNILLDKDSKGMNFLTELLLFESSRSQLYSECIIPKLNQGISIGQDRSGDSSIAYQGYARGLDIELIKKLNSESTFGYSPDLVFVIDIDARKGLEKQLKLDRMSLDGIKFHEKVNKGYLEIAKQNPENHVIIPYIENGIEEMQSIMKPYIDKIFGL